MHDHIFEIDNVQNSLGFLGFLENGKIPFEIKRIYYISGVFEGVRRGQHGHKKLKQILVAATGSFQVEVVNRFGQKNYTLDRPSIGLYIPEMSWRELYNFSESSCCLVIASEVFEKEDYIYDFQDFSRIIQATK